MPAFRIALPNLMLHLLIPFGACLAASACGGGGGNPPPPPPQNQAPTADIAASTVLGNAPFDVEFSAAGSSDPDGNIVSYQWDFDGDSFVDFNSPQPDATYMYTAPGTVTVTLQVVDDDGAADTETIPIITGAPHADRVVVDTEGRSGDPHLQMALVGGLPAAIYEAQAGGTELRFARATDATFGSWQVTTISNASPHHASLSVVDGNPAVAYLADVTPFIIFDRASSPTGDSWNNQPEVAVGAVSGASPRAITLVVADGNPALIFEMEDPADSNRAVFFIRALDAQGADWPLAPTRITPLGTGSDRLSGRMVNGRPAAAFQSGEAAFTRALDAQGAAWPAVPTAVGDVGDVDGDYQLAEFAGGPAILFEGNDGLQLFRAADANGGAWLAREVIRAPAAGESHLPRLGAVDGYPAVSFEDENDQLMLMLGHDAAGTAFASPLLVDAADTAGSFVISTGGRPGVMFLDATANSMVFRHL